MTEYIFTANYKPVEEQSIVILFDELHKELYDRGWTVNWEFNSGAIDTDLLKYNNCITLEDCVTVNPEYTYDVDGNGAWNYRLDNLENADNMFIVGAVEETDAPIGSPALVSFNADLPKVTTGMATFAGCSNLTTFNGDLSNLSTGSIMFTNCPNLKSFTSDLSSLTMGAFMFGGNYETVVSFLYDLHDPNGESSPEVIESLLAEQISTYLQMFGSPTSLDVASVQNIANTINDISNITPPADLDSGTAAMWGRIDIGIDPTLDGNSDIEAALTTIRNKGWNVAPMYDNNTSSPITPGEGLFKYNNCKTTGHCRTIDADVATDVDENGAWNYYLDNLETGSIEYKLNEDKSVFLGLFMTSLDVNISEFPFTPNTSLVSFNVDLPKLTNGNYMFYKTALTSFDSDDLPKLTNGNYMFYKTALASFDSDLPKLTNGMAMFSYTNLASFNINLPELTDGEDMFLECTSLTTFEGNLSKLTNGNYMFYETALTSFDSGDSGLPSLTSGRCMFAHAALKSWNINLPNLTNGYRMFYKNALTSWNINLPNLTYGRGMFDNTALQSFEGDLSSLTNGEWMFDGCKLDTASVQNIASTINNLSDDTDDGDYGWGIISIGIANSTPNADESSAFNEIANNKGWTVYVNGTSSSDIWTPTSSTNLTEEEQSTSIPFYAKPIEVTEEHADYTSSDGKFYSIIGAQFIYGDDLSTYGAFTSFEHAESEIMSYLNLTKIEKTDFSNLTEIEKTDFSNLTKFEKTDEKINLSNLLIKR